MSLIGEQAAVISLGTSCQSARHISLNMGLLRRRLDMTMQLRTLPLDWSLSPPSAVARWVRSPVRVPTGQAELLVTQTPFWLRHGVWLWHDTMENEAAFAPLAERLERRWERMLELRKLKRRHFILSNTQNNLSSVPNQAPQPMDFNLTGQRMRDVVSAVESLFGPEGNSFLFVSYAHRVSADAHQTGLPLAILEPDESHHDGDSAQWTAALEQHTPTER